MREQRQVYLNYAEREQILAKPKSAIKRERKTQN